MQNDDKKQTIDDGIPSIKTSAYKDLMQDDHLLQINGAAEKFKTRAQQSSLSGAGSMLKSMLDTSPMSAASSSMINLTVPASKAASQMMSGSSFNNKLKDSIFREINFNEINPISEPALQLKSPIRSEERGALYELERHQDVLRPHWHQLVIIGNGFDLECGLSSDFGSFIESRKLEFTKQSPCYTFTIWDIILQGLDDRNWCDIEKAIADWIAPEASFGNPIPASPFQRTLSCYEKRSSQIGYCFDSSLIEENITSYLLRSRPQDNTLNNEDLLNISRNDLRILENDFSSYLLSLLDKNEQYVDAAGVLLRDILAFDRPNAKSYEIEESILSFNYTASPAAFQDKDYRAKYVNIHGELEKEIVFGIDGTNRMDNLDALPFTKTYRIMSFNTLDTNTLVHLPFGNKFGDLGTKVVKFYGHSLGDADYSYFQAIFDEIKLYESDVKLIFFYRPYKSNGKEIDEETVKEEMMKKVIKLLAVYGQTLDNQDHGKNLIHKLLLEGRLSVVRL